MIHQFVLTHIAELGTLCSLMRWCFVSGFYFYSRLVKTEVEINLSNCMVMVTVIFFGSKTNTLAGMMLL